MSAPGGKLTRAEFLAALAAVDPRLVIAPPYSIVPCYCGDPNCKGWRLVRSWRDPSEFYAGHPEDARSNRDVSD